MGWQSDFSESLMRVGVRCERGARRLIAPIVDNAEGDDGGCGRSLLIDDGNEQSGIGAVLTVRKPQFPTSRGHLRMKERRRSSFVNVKRCLMRRTIAAYSRGEVSSSLKNISTAVQRAIRICIQTSSADCAGPKTLSQSPFAWAQT